MNRRFAEMITRNRGAREVAEERSPWAYARVLDLHLAAVGPQTGQQIHETFSTDPSVFPKWETKTVIAAALRMRVVLYPSRLRRFVSPRGRLVDARLDLWERVV